MIIGSTEIESFTLSQAQVAQASRYVNPIFMCKDPEHGFPTHLHVPSGKKYVHYCPSCRCKSVVMGVVVS